MLNPKAIRDNQNAQESQTASFAITHFPTFTRIFQSLVLHDWLEKLSIKTAVRTMVATVLLTTFGTTHAAAYEMFGKEAYNVGGHVDRPLYGQSGAAVFHENHDNPHLLHSVHQGKYGVVYVNKATGKCLIAHNGNNAAPTGYWTCNPDDPKMNWKLHNVGGGAYLFENMAYRNQCLDNPYRSNGGLLHMYRCDGNNYNQKFWRVQTHGGYQDGAPWYIAPPSNPQPLQKVRVKAQAVATKQRHTLIRTGGGNCENNYYFYKDRCWSNTERVFLDDGIAKGWNQQDGNRYCSHKWDRLPQTVKTTDSAEIIAYNSQTKEVQAEADLGFAGLIVKAQTVLSGQVAALLGITEQNSTEKSNQIEFEIYYRGDVMGRPVVNVYHVWYHRDLGLCIANPHT